MQERRKYVRDKVNAKVSLRHTDISGKAYDLSERGIGLRIPRSMQGPIPSTEVLQLYPRNGKTAPCQVEAELKWNSRSPNSTLLGFEIHSVQSDSCKEFFETLSHEHDSGQPSIH
ncbi:MAG TPA: PilZ domain-containing protein [Rectinemataceae bacterium]|nr:PilZ domain-containing protein [Rectinemataceae bacterium]